MDIYLSINNNEETVQLPVVPQSFAIESTFSNEAISTITSNDIKKFGNRGLKSIELSSFFPVKEYKFSRNKSMLGWEYVKTIEKWRDKAIPVRLIITDTGINMAVTIDGFTYGVQDGAGDIYYSLRLSEYKFVQVNKIQAIPVPKPVIKKPPAPKPVSKKVSTSSKKYTNTTSGNSQAKTQVMSYTSVDKQTTKLSNTLTNLEKKQLSGQADRIDGSKAGEVKIQQEHRLSAEAKKQMAAGMAEREEHLKTNYWTVTNEAKKKAEKEKRYIEDRNKDPYPSKTYNFD